MSAVTPPDPLPPDENVGPILLGVSKWDDYTMIIVTFLGIARYATQVAQISIGNGRHRWYIPKENYIRNNMLGWVAQILLFASICLLKVSILLLLLRIKNSRGLRWSAWAVMAGLVITNFGCIVILLAECDPVEAYWTGSGKCWDARVRIYAIYLTIGILLTCMIDSATGFGIARAASLGIKTSDLSWVYAITAIWSNLELYLGIVGANLALSRSIYGYFFNKNKSNVASSYAQSGSNLAYNNSGFRHDTFPRPPRAPSPSRSDNSDIPLEPRNKMQSNIWVREDPSKESIGRAT
ncbi:hypothetical protein B0J15DRAFT_389987 [Fusarium solani]|uniref:Rhodopsin domain-containing protein n=1 Tax=Fusarium solani TaxID=169388 RepID=A0A9P9R6U5_FUSSL|nr:uncharacterized protein B0J15DRAFT_389987 [Fusarium solani]KAH7268551.1 hypothetical protein B0J15DRAFT_389987 [Fusarium solani]